MKVWVGVAVAAMSLGIARGARILATAERDDSVSSEPYAPSEAAAPFIALGYREAAADALFVRLRGYFGDTSTTPEGVAALCEAIVALDPQFHRTYEYCGGAMTWFSLGINGNGRTVDPKIFLRAIALLERGTKEFPKDWRIPDLAGQIYTQDLQTNDPAQRRAWDEKGMLLVESAIRKPGAPAELQDWAAVMRTKYGEQQRAIRDLREILLLTTDTKARKILLDRLAKLEHQDVDAIAGELFSVRRDFDRRHNRERPGLPPTMYVLLGARLKASFDPIDLATGGRDLTIAAPEEKLEPVTDP